MLQQQMVEKAKAGDLRVVNGSQASGDAPQKAKEQTAAEKKKRRWDQTAEDTPSTKKAKSSWEHAETPSNSRWDETPGRSKGGETPGATPGQSTRMWDATPGHATPGAVTPGRGDSTPGHQATPSARRNRWDETPRTERGECLLILDTKSCKFRFWSYSPLVCLSLFSAFQKFKSNTKIGDFNVSIT